MSTEPETRTTARLLARGFNSHILDHGPDGDYAGEPIETSDGHGFIVSRGGAPFNVRVERSPLAAGNALPRTPLIHDLAIVLRGVLHPDVEVGPPARLASRRLANVLGIADGEINTWNVQARLGAAFGVTPDEPTKKAGQ